MNVTSSETQPLSLFYLKKYFSFLPPLRTALLQQCPIKSQTEPGVRFHVEKCRIGLTMVNHDISHIVLVVHIVNAHQAAAFCLMAS